LLFYFTQAAYYIITAAPQLLVKQISKEDGMKNRLLSAVAVFVAATLCPLGGLVTGASASEQAVGRLMSRQTESYLHAEMDCRPTTTKAAIGMVKEAYKEMFGTKPDQRALNFWVHQLIKNGKTENWMKKAMLNAVVDAYNKKGVKDTKELKKIQKAAKALHTMLVIMDSKDEKTGKISSMIGIVVPLSPEESRKVARQVIKYTK
jgi:hypothetical protein